MAHFTESCTIYNFDGTAWQRTVLRGIMWRVAIDKAVASNGIINISGMANVTIPQNVKTTGNREYINSKEYKQLADKSQHWTVNVEDNKDMLVLGEVTSEISGAYTISQLRADYDNAMIVKSLKDNTARDLLKHWAVGAK